MIFDFPSLSLSSSGSTRIHNHKRMKANLHLYLYYIYISNPFLAINPSRFAKYGLIGTGTRVLVMTPSPCFIRVFVNFFWAGRRHRHAHPSIGRGRYRGGAELRSAGLTWVWASPVFWFNHSSINYYTLPSFRVLGRKLDMRRVFVVCNAFWIVYV